VINRPGVRPGRRLVKLARSNGETGASRTPAPWAAVSSASTKAKPKARFTVVLDKQFDQRQRRHESEIQSLEAQVKKIKELVRLRNEKRREIVAQRLEQVRRDAEGLGW
jgi:hypothetical protein